MNRWKSPQAGRLAERAAQDSEQRRGEKRRSWLMIVGVALASAGLMAADYFWLRSQARQRHERRHPHHQRGTNTPALQTNHLNAPATAAGPQPEPMLKESMKIDRTHGRIARTADRAIVRRVTP